MKPKPMESIVSLYRDPLRVSDLPPSYPRLWVDSKTGDIKIGAPLDQDASVEYRVELDVYNGPLDLLLYLIKKDELDIYDIPIARITEQYLAHIEMMEKLDLEPAGEFLVMASTLLRIKARMLLPVQRPGEEIEEDPRAELVQRLLEYKKFKEAARRLEAHETDRLRSWTRPLDAALVEDARAHPEEEEFEVSLPHLVRALQGVLTRFEAIVTHEIQLEPVALEEKVQLLREQLAQHGGRLAFGELFERARTRLEVIVTFMAMLELIKGGLLQVHQAENFSELWLFQPAAAGPAAAGRAPADGAAAADGATEEGRAER
jgi:segregation and condensation protein A